VKNVPIDNRTPKKEMNFPFSLLPKISDGHSNASPICSFRTNYKLDIKRLIDKIEPFWKLVFLGAATSPNDTIQSWCGAAISDIQMKLLVRNHIGDWVKHSYPSVNSGEAQKGSLDGNQSFAICSVGFSQGSKLIRGNSSIDGRAHSNKYTRYDHTFVSDGRLFPRLLPFLMRTLSVSGLFVGFSLVISSLVFFHDRRALLYGIIIVLLSAAAFYYILGNELPMLRTVRSTNRGKAERLRSSQRVPIQMPESIGNSDFHSRASADIGILDPEGPKARYCSCLIVLQVIRESSLNHPRPN